jgi:hypothetical protein
MTAQIRRSSLLGLALVAACSSAGGHPDAAPPADAPADAGAGGDATPPPEDATAPPRDTRPQPTGLALPAGVAPARRLIGEPARLTGNGPTACSHQEPASGDGHRWCVFYRRLAPDGDTELWTVDITAAATEAPRCDGSSSTCRRLTSKLWTEFPLGGPVHPYSHEFHGDTLVYYADAISRPRTLHRGPVYGWRPGWSQPRRISTPEAVMCWGHQKLPIAHCLEDVVGAVMMPDLVALGAGPLADMDGLALPSLGWIHTFANGAPSWQAGFSPAGDAFLVSSPDPDPTVEALRTVATGNLGRAPLKEVVRDVSSWEVSGDGQHVLFFRPESTTSKALQVADFPSGANVTKIGSAVKDYLFVGSAASSLIYVTESDPDHGAFNLLRDLRLPGAAQTVFTYNDPIEDVRLSPDLRYTAWVDAHFQVRVVSHADLRSCDLNAQPRRAGFAPAFLDSAGLVLWSEEATDDVDRRDGYLADPAGCQGKRRFGQGVELILPVGDRGVVFTDEMDPGTARVTLKYAAIAGGKEWPAAGPVRIHGDVDGSSVFLVFSGEGPRAGPVLVLFRVVSGGPEMEGTYVFGPLPF